MDSCRAPFVPGVLVIALLLAAAGSPAAAQPIDPADVPPALRPWIPWVLDEVRDLGCPRVQGRAVCAWPGRLRLDLDRTGGTFSLDLAADRDTEVRLPGSPEAWPEEVILDGRRSAVFARGDSPGSPRVRVAAGRHRVSGRFSWSRMPESLALPTEIALVDLRLDGSAVPRPRREKGGLLWLRARSDEGGGESEALRLQVFRQVEDGIPLFVETRIQLEVSGRAREAALPQAVLPGTVPVWVGGELAARVEDGALRVQLRAGRYVVRVRARVEGQPEAIVRPERPAASPAPGPGAEALPAAWPEREVWVFAANETLRQVELAGSPPVDPSRTELPDEWRDRPAFLVEAGGRLELRTVRRGQPETTPDALALGRRMWLDQGGGSVNVRDSFSGVLHGATRLDLIPPGSLGRVSVGGQDQLVTENPETGAPGVELRRTDLALEADSRVPLSGAIPAVGWTTGVESLRTTLHVPPGFTLLATSGVDQAPGTWTNRWTLLAFFFVLLVAFAASRLFDRRTALVAAAALVLTYGEAGAPWLVWLSLLGAIALRRVAPRGRLQALGRVWFLASAVVLVWLVVPFARDQVKDALFPQVGPQHGEGFLDALEDSGFTMGGAKRAPAALPAPPPQPGRVQAPTTLEEDTAAQSRDDVFPDERRRQDAPMEGEVSGGVPGGVAGGMIGGTQAGYAANVALEQDPRAVIQTGPGVPTWSWRTYTLAWTGPVGRDHEMRLVLASPGLNRLLMLARLGLVALLAWVILTGRWPRLPRPRAPETLPAMAGAALLILGPLAGAARAQDTPDAEVLADLKKRLTRDPACTPSCVITPSVRLVVGQERLDLAAEVHAAADGTWPIPGPVASFVPTEVRLDGVPTSALAHLADGFLHVRVGPGVHRVELSGPLPPGDSLTLQFADVPRRARATAPGWDVSGLRPDGPPDSSILLSRRLAARGSAAVSEGRYAPWLLVSRTLGFGVAWTVETTVTRMTPRGEPVAVRIPLLPGEAPTRAALAVQDGAVSVSLGAEEVSTSWRSTLEQEDALTLEAPEGQPWSELWRVQCSTVWSCTTEGIPPVERAAAGVLEPAFRPWPGESLTVRLAHPAGAPGQTLTVDSVRLDAEPGTRLERATLALTARASREQPLVVDLPPDAEVQSVTVDGAEKPSRPEAGQLRVTVPAGTHDVLVRWQQARGIGAVHAGPSVSLSAPAVNASQSLAVPDGRWLLFTWGPAWGPVVLFWPYLVFVVATALGLGRMPDSPLTSTQWVLLGLGLSQIDAAGALVVAAFVFALARRGRRWPESAAVFDLVQLGLALWAFVSLVLLYSAIHRGLLFPPDMQVAGNGSSGAHLVWYADRVDGTLPGVGVVSLPLWVYRIAMLLWALWLAASLVRGVSWGWRAFAEGGLWRSVVLRRGPRPAPADSTDSAGAADGGPSDRPGDRPSTE